MLLGIIFFKDFFIKCFQKFFYEIFLKFLQQCVIRFIQWVVKYDNTFLSCFKKSSNIATPTTRNTKSKIPTLEVYQAEKQALSHLGRCAIKTMKLLNRSKWSIIKNSCTAFFSNFIYFIKPLFANCFYINSISYFRRKRLF